MAKTQREMRQRHARSDVDTHHALALAKAYSGSRIPNAASKSLKPKVGVARPDLRLVEKPKRRVGFHISNKVVLAYLVGSLALFAAIGMRAEMAATQMRLNHLNSELTSMQTQHERLKVQLAQLESPGRVVSYAEKHLGMVYPTQVGYLGVAPQKNITQSTQSTQIPLTPQVLSAPNTLFAPAGEAGGGAPTGPTSPSTKSKNVKTNSSPSTSSKTTTSSKVG